MSRYKPCGSEDCQLLQDKNEIERLQGELETLNERMECGHRKVDMDDSYGGCVFCQFKTGYEDADTENEKLQTERDEAHSALRHVHWLMGQTIPEWIINDVCNYITSKLPDTAPGQEADNTQEGELDRAQIQALETIRITETERDEALDEIKRLGNAHEAENEANKLTIRIIDDEWKKTKTERDEARTAGYAAGIAAGNLKTERDEAYARLGECILGLQQLRGAESPGVRMHVENVITAAESPSQEADKALGDGE